MEEIYLALIVAIPAMLSPLLLAVLTNWNARKLREQDWKRQDEVAEKARQVSAVLVKNNEAVAHATAETHSQLRVIHALVNSTLTAALQGRLDAHRKSIILMRRIIQIDHDHGVSPSDLALAEIKESEREVADLEMQISDRLEQARASQRKE